MSEAFANSEPQSPLASLALLIPAWKPEAVAGVLVAALAEAGFGAIVVVDDGSGEAYAERFAALLAHPRVRVLRHAVNLGKGRALKTGINHILCEMPWATGVVTADADGQHSAEDIVSVARQAQSSGARLVLGVRSFAGDVPRRSRLGNELTRRAFGRLTGVRLADTQTGLRAMARAELPQLLQLEGERYEYEMTVLAHLCRKYGRPLEVPIETIYFPSSQHAFPSSQHAFPNSQHAFPNSQHAFPSSQHASNRTSHFKPVRDSMRIVSVLLRLASA